MCGVEPNAPGMTNVCVSAGCKQQKKKRCTFGMCIDCCKLRPGAGTLNGKCKLYSSFAKEPYKRDYIL